MKVYKLSVISPLANPSFSKKNFKTRDAAIRYAFKFLPATSMVEEEIIKQNDKHNIEYICQDKNRFTVQRLCIQG